MNQIDNVKEILMEAVNVINMAGYGKTYIPEESPDVAKLIEMTLIVSMQSFKQIVKVNHNKDVSSLEALEYTKEGLEVFKSAVDKVIETVKNIEKCND